MLARTEQGVEAEAALLELVTNLKARKRICGNPLGLDELLDPFEERDIGKDQLPGTDIEIVAKILAGPADPIEIEIIQSDEEESSQPPAITTTEMI